MPQSPLDPMGGSMGKPDRTPHSHVPSQPDIDTLEKLAWDAHVEHVVIWYRDQIAELLARVRETERELTLSTKALQRRVADLEAEHVSREDREAAFDLTVRWARTPHPDTDGPNAIGLPERALPLRAEARRLLKLEDA